MPLPHTPVIHKPPKTTLQTELYKIIKFNPKCTIGADGDLDFDLGLTVSGCSCI